MVLQRNYVLFSRVFGELQQSCVYLVMVTEGMLPWNCRVNVREFHCVWKVVTLESVRSDKTVVV